MGIALSREHGVGGVRLVSRKGMALDIYPIGESMALLSVDQPALERGPGRWCRGFVHMTQVMGVPPQSRCQALLSLSTNEEKSLTLELSDEISLLRSTFTSRCGLATQLLKGNRSACGHSAQC